jgi:flagellar hook-associated protein 2
VVFDGVTVTSATNKFEGIISGVTLQAKKVDLTSTYSVAVASNIAGIKEDIDTFVAKYNDVMSYLSTKTSATATDRDPALEQIRSQLRNALTESVASGGAYRTLAQIGVTADRSGTLSVDDDKLTDALTDHFDDVAKLISAYGEGDNAYLRFSSSGSKTQDGTYAVNITGLGAGFGGTIGGYAAIGAAGGLLTGAKGTPVEGLAIVYTGSSTGDVGNVSFHAGVFEKFDRLIDGYLSYSDGLLKTRENSINRQIRYLNDQISMKEQQLDKVETRLNAQFAKMEVALSQLQTQNAFLTANSAASS